MSSSSLQALLVATLALLGGCSDIPAGGAPDGDPRIRALTKTVEPRLGALAVAPIVTFTLAPDEASKGWKLEEVDVLYGDAVRRSVARGLASSERWTSVRLGDGDTLADAWSHHEDFVASVAVENLRTRFLGHNGWWIPNIINFVCNVIPAWWVATEEYSLSFDARVTLTSVESGAPIVDAHVPVTVSGTFDDFDRGWQFFGPIHSSLDADGWRRIATTLLPAAQRELAVQLAGELERAVRGVPGGELREARRKTLVLAVGVTHYQDPRAFPPVPYATDDALRMAESFVAAGSIRENVVTLLDGAATVDAVRARALTHLGRARDGDGVVFYFAGYGTRRPDGEAALLLGDAAPGKETGTLTLSELASLLRGLRGMKVVILDAGFGGSGRSILSAAAPSAPPSDLVAFDKAGLAAIVAGGPRDNVLAPEHLSNGLLTYHLVQTLARARDEPGGPASLPEFFTTVYAAVAADAELLGVTQVPRAIGLEHGFPLWLPAGARPEGRR